MNGLRAYRHYLALKKHFSDEKFNVLESPIINIPEAQFFKRNDKHLWDKLAGTYSSVELLNYMVANFVYGNEAFLYDADVAQRNYIRWVGNNQSLTYIIKTELDHLDPNIATVDLISRMHEGHVSIETLIVLSRFTDALNDLIPSMLHATVFRIQRAQCFVKFNKEKIEEILEENLWIRHEPG